MAEMTEAPEQEQAAPQAQNEPKSRRRRRKERAAEREPEVKTVRAPAIVSLLTSRPPAREELEREAAAEFYQAVSPALELLHAAVPDASSPEEASRAIESKLGPAPQDRDAQLPRHPLYSGDTLVYQQLRRHYGEASSGGSFRRGWEPGDSLPPMLGG
jgi:hypothetical protein